MCEYNNIIIARAVTTNNTCNTRTHPQTTRAIHAHAHTHTHTHTQTTRAIHAHTHTHTRQRITWGYSGSHAADVAYTDHIVFHEGRLSRMDECENGSSTISNLDVIIEKREILYYRLTTYRNISESKLRHY